MDNPLVSLLVVGATLEAVVQLLRAIWDADQRSFSITMIVVLVAALALTFLGNDGDGHDWFSAWWDLGPAVGKVVTGLLFARAAMFVHDVYNKAT
ncbi:MAG: hypothetical protein IH859_06915 [Chloroflexi bacterium]|nr:hypothetical protein [Chloroflexota bacterium]